MPPPPRGSARDVPGTPLVDRVLRALRSSRRPPSPQALAEPFRLSHRPLLAPLDLTTWRGGAGDKPSAVVVPTARPATAARSGLALAARTALEHGCPLVVLVSQDAATRAGVEALGQRITVTTQAGPRRPDTLVLQVADRGTRLTTFGVDRLEVSTAYRRGGNAEAGARVRPNNVGRKRNLALLLAAGLAWESALFLDDDVFVDVDVDGDGDRRPRHGRTLDAASLRAAVRATTQGGHLAVGWTLRDFDDNSVLCRIAAQCGEPQDQFVGAGALLVPVHRRLPFFPSIYNEDWLFLLGLLRRGGAGRGDLLDGGDVHQDEYPAYVAGRAASEELGDVLGEGLLSLMHAGAPGQAASREFWRNALEKRCELRERLQRMVEASAHDRRADMLEALAAAARVHERCLGERDHWVSQFADFGGTWERDLHDWGRRLHQDDLPAPRRLLASGEFAGARTFGRFATPEEFLAAFAGPRCAEAAKEVLVA